MGDRFPDDQDPGWPPVAQEMSRSPLFQAMVREKPQEFPDLVRYFRD